MFLTGKRLCTRFHAAKGVITRKPLDSTFVINLWKNAPWSGGTSTSATIHQDVLPSSGSALRRHCAASHRTLESSHHWNSRISFSFENWRWPEAAASTLYNSIRSRNPRSMLLPSTYQKGPMKRSLPYWLFSNFHVLSSPVLEKASANFGLHL